MFLEYSYVDHRQDMTGHFLLAGLTDVPFMYKVRRTRNGGSYCLRQVEAYQDQPSTRPYEEQSEPIRSLCFVAVISFKRNEIPHKYAAISHQQITPAYLRDIYESVLDCDPESHELCPATDGTHSSQVLEKEAERHRLATIFPGVDVRKVDMTDYNRSKRALNGNNPEQYRQLHFYRLIPEKGDDSQDLNLHLCAHLYASDRNSLEMIPRALGRVSKHSSMASLAHTVVFHGRAQDLNMLEKGEPKWFVQEAWASRSGEGRACHESRLLDWESGTVVGTTLQDGMLRIGKDLEEDRGMRKQKGRL